MAGGRAAHDGTAIASRFSALPTAAKLLLFISLALLPLGLGLVWVAQQRHPRRRTTPIWRTRRSAGHRRHAGDRKPDRARRAGVANCRQWRSSRCASSDPCATAAHSLACRPGVANNFALRDAERRSCSARRAISSRSATICWSRRATSGCGSLRDNDRVFVRVGVVGGMATGSLTREQLRGAALASSDGLEPPGDQRRPRPKSSSSMSLPPSGRRSRLQQWTYPIANGQLNVRIAAWASSDHH